MIVRNGAATLPACLKSVVPVVDELIVVDTGSTDDSVAIASSFGARILPITWQGDFAAARNEYLKAARCAWVLSLDADDRLERIERSALDALTSAYPATSFVFTIKNYFFAKNGAASEGIPAVRCHLTHGVRLFPRHRGVEYRYPIHETLLPSLRESGIGFRKSPFAIHHMGYLCAHTDLVQKAAKYAEIGLKKLLQYPEDFRAHLELGKVLLFQGELDFSERLFTECLRLNPMCSDGYFCLALSAFRRGRYEKTCYWIERGLEQFPQHGRLIRMRGFLETRMRPRTYWRACGPLRA